MRYIAISILFLIAFAGEAQDINIDSMKIELNEIVKNNEYDSTGKVMYYFLADYLRRTDPLNALDYHYKMFALAKEYQNNLFMSSAYVCIGTIYRDQGLNGRALENFYNATKYFDENQYGHFCWIYIFIGNVYYSEEVYEDAIKFYSIAASKFDSLGINDKKNDDIENNDNYWNNAGKAVAYNNIALCQRQIGHDDSAMYYFRYGLSLRERMGQYFAIAHSHLYIGEMYYRQKMYDSAMAEFKLTRKLLDKALAIEDINFVEIQVNLAECIYNMGLVYNEFGDEEKAELYLGASIDSLMAIGDKKSIAMKFIDLAKYYKRKEKPIESLENAQKALDIAIRNELLLTARDACSFLFDVNKSLRRVEDALRYSELNNSLKDSIQNKFNEFSIQEIALRINNEKKLIELEKDRAVKESNIEQQKNIIILLSILAFVVLLGIGIFWRLFIVKKRLNSSLEDKNRLLVEINEKLKISEANLAGANTMLYEKNRKLVDSENNLKEINATKDKFFSIIAHDLKNPFGSFKNGLEMLDDSYDHFSEDERKAFLAELRQSSQYLYNLLENLLTWSSSQRGKIDFNPELSNFTLIIKSNVDFLELNAKKKNIALVFEQKEEFCAVFDPNMMLTVARNLISNAIKFTPHGGIIVISARRKGNMIEAIVKDNGVGISQENVKKLFRIDKTHTSLGTDSERGTGLGLILCKEFINLHNGNIWVESELGKGSEFHFTFPVEI